MFKYLSIYNNHLSFNIINSVTETTSFNQHQAQNQHQDDYDFDII